MSRDRYAQCDGTCTTDCGACKGNGRPVSDADAVHVLPVNDLIRHDDDDCPCGPVSEPIKRADGSVGWVVIHHSLDGREANER